ncbi:ras and EF-hand domain-containing protein [Aplysia californica]|uniref:Ras and EF-hand domain-containing protein n=1 Tax=Aplysia californica TaxID=6500 RepID=A0ABM0ZUM8_APLCA|nr:ras and EF-hand domain-containing protein [Aplysia californica]
MSLKKRLEEIHTENRMLKSELTDAQTSLALVKSQMTSVKQQLDEKTYEMEVENKTVEDYVNEQDNLRRQLQMLHEANKNLLDTNDNLREMIDTTATVPPGFKRTASTDSGASGRSNRSASPNFPRKGSVMSDYIDTSPGNRPLLHATLHEETGMMPRFLALNHIESCDDDNIAEDLGDQHVFLSPDSGHSTLRDLNDINDDTEIDSVSVQSDVRRSRRHKRLRPSVRVPEEDELDSHDEMDTDSEHPKSPSTEAYRLQNDHHKRSGSVGSHGSTKSNRSNRSLAREESVFSQSSRSSRGSSMRRQLPALPTKETAVAPKVVKDPERMYKIVLAGDAAVGKSSFIVRLCKGKFVPNLSSTLGVDFQTKMLDVDAQPTALQLWDTAGQERFRSVARTYFRRADGVLLLYDVTYERSFLNIREWVDSIEEGAQKKIPFMLVGNKTDAREELESQGRRVVKYEDGVRLSRELDALFIETSAKDGSNITEAVIELTRLLRTNEDMEVKTVGMQLHDMNEKKSGSCCKR